MRLNRFIFASACLFSANALADSCINVASNQVINFGQYGNFINDTTGDVNAQIGGNVMCAQIQGITQVNGAIQQAFQQGIPFSVGLFSAAGQSNGNGLGGQANLANITTACGTGGSNVFGFMSGYNGFVNQFNAQATCGGDFDTLVNLPVFLNF